MTAGWQLAGRKMLPIKNFQKLRFGWGVQVLFATPLCLCFPWSVSEGLLLIWSYFDRLLVIRCHIWADCLGVFEVLFLMDCL